MSQVDCRKIFLQIKNRHCIPTAAVAHKCWMKVAIIFLKTTMLYEQSTNAIIWIKFRTQNLSNEQRKVNIWNLWTHFNSNLNLPLYYVVKHPQNLCGQNKNVLLLDDLIESDIDEQTKILHLTDAAQFPAKEQKTFKIKKWKLCFIQKINKIPTTNNNKDHFPKCGLLV